MKIKIYSHRIEQMRLLFFGFVLSILCVPAQGNDKVSLINIANTYNGDTFWGKELGEAPILYQLDAMTDFNNKVHFLTENLNKLSLIEDDLKKTQLFLDLQNYTQQELFVQRACQPGVWDYAEAYQLVHFFDNISYQLDGATGEKNVELIDRTLSVLDRVLDIYTEKLDFSLERNLIPSSSSFIFNYMNAERSGLALADFEKFLNEFKNKHCTTCDVDTRYFTDLYKIKTEPRLAKFFNKLVEMQALSGTYVYSLPKTIKTNCYTQIISAVGGKSITPKEMLALGERELARVEQAMFNIISKLKQFEGKDSIHEKLVFVNEYMAEINQQPNEFAVDAKEYIQKIQFLVDRTVRFLPRVTSYTVGKLSIKDIAPEGGRLSTGVVYSSGDGTILLDSNNQYPIYNLASLAVHEGIPGHHLERQITNSFIQDNEFEKNYFNGVKVEGWAFYMEEFMDEIGFYEAPLQQLGYLDEIRIRALRLIIPYRFFFDGWHRNQALEYAKKHTSTTDFRLNSELSRNSHWRGQVLQYMIGKESIIQMKDKAKLELKAKYSDIKFHDFILSHGNINMKTMESLLNNWLALEK